MKLKEALDRIGALDKKVYDESCKKWLSVAKPLYSLGRLESLISQIAGISGECYAPCDKKALVIMCADNGVVCEGVTQCGQEITAMVTENFTCKKASVAIMSEKAGCDLKIVDIGVSTDVKNVSVPCKKVRYGTANMAKGAAMSRSEAEKAIEIGIDTVGELKEKGYEIIATGEMGIGNTTTSAAITSVLLDMPPEIASGRGAGLSSSGLERKIEVIKKSIEINDPDKNDIIDVLSKIGGLDIAGLCGVFLGGAIYHLPIIIDGFISSVAALCACKLSKDTKDYIIPSHKSKEPAAAAVLAELGLEPYIDCGMFLGEGSGAVALMPIIDMASSVYHDMQTFGVWDKTLKPYEVLK